MLTRSHFAIKDFNGFPFPLFHHFIEQKRSSYLKNKMCYMQGVSRNKTCDGSKLLAGLIFHFSCLDFKVVQLTDIAYWKNVICLMSKKVASTIIRGKTWIFQIGHFLNIVFSICFSSRYLVMLVSPCLFLFSVHKKRFLLCTYASVT